MNLEEKLKLEEINPVRDWNKYINQDPSARAAKPDYLQSDPIHQAKKAAAKAFSKQPAHSH